MNIFGKYDDRYCSCSSILKQIQIKYSTASNSYFKSRHIFNINQWICSGQNLNENKASRMFKLHWKKLGNQHMFYWICFYVIFKKKNCSKCFVLYWFSNIFRIANDYSQIVLPIMCKICSESVINYTQKQCNLKSELKALLGCVSVMDMVHIQIRPSPKLIIKRFSQNIN